MLNGELYRQRLQKLIYLYLSTDCFVKIALHSSEPKIKKVYYMYVKLYPNHNAVSMLIQSKTIVREVMGPGNKMNY